MEWNLAEESSDSDFAENPEYTRLKKKVEKKKKEREHRRKKEKERKGKGKEKKVNPLPSDSLIRKKKEGKTEYLHNQ